MKDAYIRFRLTDELKAQAEAAASRSGKTVTDYLTDLIRRDVQPDAACSVTIHLPEGRSLKIDGALVEVH